LVVEVADSSVRFDRGLKARVYARARIADYWVVNLMDRTVEVYRKPTIGNRRPARYEVVHVARPGERLIPLAAPAAVIAVADLLP
jgi:Uma2 family endonuclease